MTKLLEEALRAVAEWSDAEQDADDLICFWIGSHADYDRLLVGLR